jgi:hypothetical protein
MRHLCIVVAGVVAAQSTLLAVPPPTPKPAVGDVYVVNAVPPQSQQLCDQSVCSPGSHTQVASLILPAGAYTIAAKLVISNWSSTGPAQSFCYLYAGGTIIDATAASTSLEIATVPASLQGARVFTTSDSLSIQCADTNGLTAALNWQLMATRVASVNLQ